MKAYPPKSTLSCLLGRKVSNVGREWYIKGGTFCCRCLVAYTFDESYKIFTRDREVRRNGLDVPHCGQLVRTRSKTKHNVEGGFWKKLEGMQ
jgi:hypothetical protein